MRVSACDPNSPGCAWDCLGRARNPEISETNEKVKIKSLTFELEDLCFNILHGLLQGKILVRDSLALHCFVLINCILFYCAVSFFFFRLQR